MVDFAALTEKMQIKRAMLGPEYPYKDCDRDLFDGKQMRTGALTLTADYRPDPYSDAITLRALDSRGQRVEVIFDGRRADDFRAGVGAALKELHETAILGDDFSDAFVHRIDAQVTGAFKKRCWKDRDGQSQFVWQLTAAQWTYTLLERGTLRRVTEGRLPSASYATLTQAAPVAA